MDLAFFESALPVTHDIFSIVIASGWALLLGNLVFQAAKSMMAGLGFEADDPRELFTRTFVFAFFLLSSRQICAIGLGLSATLMQLLQIPDAVNITIIDENAFGIGASWLLVIIFTFVMLWQLVKLFLQVGERYFLVGLLTIMAPWAFAMGGSKSTADIFKGWVRMFASMCLMMVLNVVILKLMLSAVSSLPSGADSVPWMILIVAIARVGRKIESVIVKVGLNPALTGDGLGRGLPGMLSYMVIRGAASKVLNTAGGSKSTTKNGGATNSSATRNSATASNKATSASSATRNATANSSSRGNSTSQSSANVSSRNTQGGNSVHSPNASESKYDTSVNAPVNSEQTSSVSSRNSAVKHGVSSVGQSNNSRNTSVTSQNPKNHSSTQNAVNSGISGTPTGGISSRGGTVNPVSKSAGTTQQVKPGTHTQSRFTAVPQSAKPTRVNRPFTMSPGSAGTSRTAKASSASIRDSNTSHATINNNENTSVNRASSRPSGVAGTAQPKNGAPEAPMSTTPNPATPTAAREKTSPNIRDTSRQSQPPTPGSAGTQPNNPARPTSTAETRSGNAGTAQNAPRPSSQAQQQANQRHRGNTAPSPTPAQPANTPPRSASRENTPPTRESTRQTQKPAPGSAGTQPNVAANAAKTANSYKPRQPDLGKGRSTKNNAKNVTEKRKKSKYRSGGKDDSEQQ